MSGGVVPKPYVGVTGYTSLAQANAVSDAAKELLGDRVLMDGYLIQPQSVSSRWKSEDQRYAKYASRFVSRDAAAEAFAAPRTGSLRVVHLCSDIATQLDEQLQDVFDFLGLGVDGFQVNWLERPDPRELAAFKKSADRIRTANDLDPLVMVVQLHPNVLTAASEDVNQLIAYVATYVEANAATHVLYDPSGGQGIGFDPQKAIDVMRAMRNAFPELQLGVAGGLSPENVVKKIGTVWRADPNVCIDTEARVRTEQDALDLERASAFVRAALRLGINLERLEP